MRLTRIPIVILTLGVLIMGCGEDEDANLNGVAYPKIHLRLAPGTQRAEITRVVLTVSGPDMEPEEFELDVDGEKATGTISIPSGRDRLFTVTVYSESGVEAETEQLVELLEPGTEFLLEMSLEPVGPEWEGEYISFEVLIRMALNKPEGPLTDQDYASLQALDIDEWFDEPVIITDLTGVERCINLQYLWLGNTQVADLSPLSNLTELRDLGLGGEQITDLSPLTGLSNLEWLDLWYTQITDFSPLSNMISLRSLYLAGDNIDNSTLLSISGLFNLEWLDLWDTQITDFGPLGQMFDLNGLGLGGQQIDDSVLPIVASLTNLEDLDLYDTGIMDFSPLSDMAELRYLSLWDNQISDVSFLIGMTGLRDLDLDYNQIIDISPLSNLTDLEWLSLDRNQISDVSPLSDLTKLIDLQLLDNQVSDIGALVDLNSLRWLDLRNNPLNNESINVYIPELQARGIEVEYGTEDLAPGIRASLRTMGELQHRSHTRVTRREWR